MSIYTIKLNDPTNDDFQLLGVVTKEGMESEEKKRKYIGSNVDFSKYQSAHFDHVPWLVPERDTENGKGEFIPVDELESVGKIEVRLLSAKLTRSFSGDNFTAVLPPDHPMRDLIFPYRTGIYIFENDVPIWNGEVIRTKKKLSGEMTLEAVGMVDVVNYFCPPQQTFKRMKVSDIIDTLLIEYYITVPDFRTVIFDHSVISCDNTILEEYSCDGITPILTLLKELKGLPSSDHGKYYTLMVPSQYRDLTMNELSELENIYIVYNPKNDFDEDTEEFMLQFGVLEDGNNKHYIYLTDEGPAHIFGKIDETTPRQDFTDGFDPSCLVTNFLQNNKALGKYVPLIVYGYVFNTWTNIEGGLIKAVLPDENSLFQVRYGDNLIDLEITKSADNGNVFRYEADSVDVIRLTDDFTKKDEDDREEEIKNGTEEQEQEIKWTSESRPFVPSLYRVNTSKIYNEETEKWEDDGEEIHPIRYADKSYYPSKDENEDEDENDITKNPEFLKLFTPYEDTVTDKDDKETVKIEEDTVEQFVGLAGALPGIFEYHPPTESMQYNRYTLNSSSTPGYAYGAYGIEPMRMLVMKNAEKPWFNMPPVTDQYLCKDILDQAKELNVHIPIPIGNEEDIHAFGTIVDQNMIKLEGVNDALSMFKVLCKLNLPFPVSTSYACSAIDLSLFDHSLIKAELGNFCKIGSTPNSEGFIGIITSITYDIVNTKKTVSIQKQDATVTDMLARALDRGAILEKRFSIKSDKKDITDAEIKRGDVIFIPE